MFMKIGKNRGEQEGEQEGKQGIIQSKETKCDKKTLRKPEKASLKTLLIAFYWKYAEILKYHANFVQKLCWDRFLSDSKLDWTTVAF